PAGSAAHPYLRSEHRFSTPQALAPVDVCKPSDKRNGPVRIMPHRAPGVSIPKGSELEVHPNDISSTNLVIAAGRLQANALLQHQRRIAIEEILDIGEELDVALTHRNPIGHARIPINR